MFQSSGANFYLSCEYFLLVLFYSVLLFVVSIFKEKNATFKQWAERGDGGQRKYSKSLPLISTTTSWLLTFKWVPSAVSLLLHLEKRLLLRRAWSLLGRITISDQITGVAMACNVVVYLYQAGTCSQWDKAASVISSFHSLFQWFQVIFSNRKDKGRQCAAFDPKDSDH